MIKESFLKWTNRTLKRKGFTLTEVLITLTVVGIVSALTVPTLMNRYSQKTFNKMTSKTKLTILNTLDMLMTDEGKSTLSASGMRTDDGVKSYLTTYYRVNTVCGDNPTSRKCLAAGNYTNKSGTTSEYPSTFNCIKANDGATICMSPLNADNEGEVFVDTNAAQGPNVEGKDIFRLTYLNDGQFGGDDALVGKEYVLKVLREAYTGGDDAGGINKMGVASVSPTQKAMSEDESTTISATFFPGWELQKFEVVSGSCSVDSSSGKVVMGASDCTVKVVAKRTKYRITVEQGTCETISGSAYPKYYDDTNNISAEPEWLGSFNNWSVSGDCDIANAGSTSTSLTVHGNCTATPSCNPAPAYDVIVSAGYGIASAYPYTSPLKIGRSTYVGYTAKTGYRFSNISTGNTCSASGTKLTMNQNSTAACYATVNGTEDDFYLTVNAGTGGSASGSGWVTYKSSKSITATPDSEYSFAGWSGSCSISNSGSASTTVIMGPQNCTATASFSKNTYTLTVNAGTGGSASGGASGLNNGDTVTISATASDGYTFNSWSKSGSCSVSGNTVTMGAGNCTVTASFDANSVVTPEPQEEVTVTDDDDDDDVEQPEVTDDDDDDDVDDIPTTPPVTTTATYSLTVNAGTGGSATGSNSSLQSGASQNISATADSGYVFNGWNVASGGCTIDDKTKSSASVTMGANNCVVAAAFTENTYTLTVSAGTGGSVSSTSASVKYKDLKTIEATASSGYSFKSWSVTSGSCTLSDSTNKSTKVTMAAGNCTVTASFDEVPPNTYKLETKAETGGTTTGDNGSMTTGATQEVVASANSGYSFDAWSVSGTGCTISSTSTSTATVTMGTADCTATAAFKKNSYTLTVNAGTGGSVSPTSATVDYDDTKTVTATASTGYTFKEWTVVTGGCAIDDKTKSSATVTMGANNCTVAASFSPTYTLTVNNGSGSGSYAEGEEVTVSFVAPGAGATFKNWQKNAGSCTIKDTSSSSTTVTMGADDCNIVAIPNNSSSSGSGTYSFQLCTTIKYGFSVFDGSTYEKLGTGSASPNGTTSTCATIPLNSSSSSVIVAQYGMYDENAITTWAKIGTDSLHGGCIKVNNSKIETLIAGQYCSTDVKLVNGSYQDTGKPKTGTTEFGQFLTISVKNGDKVDVVPTN